MKLSICLIGLTLSAAACAQSEPTAAERLCGSLQNPAYGPFDYRTATPYQRNLVESNHFTPEVERLISKKTGEFGHDIGYTLRAFPNHPRALVAMQQLGEKEKTDQPRGAPYSVECFFERAMRFQPRDPLIRLLYANYLIARGRMVEAEKHMAYVAEISAADEDAFSLYNLGMLYFDIKKYDLARKYAQQAAALGLPRDGLKRRLQDVNQWEEAPAGAVVSPAASTPQPAAH